jgi:nitrogen fixation protein FixH
METALGIILLALVAVLTSLPPATAAVTTGPLNLTQQSGEMTVGLKLEPNKVGANHAFVALTSNGKKVSTAKRVTVYLRSLDMDMGLTTVQAKPTDDGNYEADVVLSMAGKWLVSVEVSPPQGDAFVTEFKISSSL